MDRLNTKGMDRLKTLLTVHTVCNKARVLLSNLYTVAWCLDVYVWCNVDISIHFFHDSQLGETVFERYLTYFGILMMFWPNITSSFYMYILHYIAVWTFSEYFVKVEKTFHPTFFFNDEDNLLPSPKNSMRMHERVKLIF